MAQLFVLKFEGNWEVVGADLFTVNSSYLLCIEDYHANSQ